MRFMSGILGRIYTCESLNSLSDCELIIEAIAEDLALKKDLFGKLEPIVSQQCLLATNTSSLSITSIGSVMKNPDRFLGIHFFNPVVMMQLTEVIPATQTNDNNVAKAISVIESWGKTVVKAKDVFTIDATMRNSGFKMGPFELMDFIGHDVNYRVTESVWKSFYYDSRYKPSFSQLRLLEAGYLGKKSGKGFYNYPHTPGKGIDIHPELVNLIFMRIISMLINEAADTVFYGICHQEDVETSVKLGLNYPKGLLEWGNEIGYHKIIETLDALYNHYHEERYRVCPLLRKWI